MTDASERMKQWLAAADARRADPCLRWLRGQLATGLFAGSAGLKDTIEIDVEGHLRLLVDNPSLCKAIEHTAQSMNLAMAHGHHPDDVRLVLTVTSMLHILRLGGGEGGAPETTLRAIEVAHEGALRQALSLASAQVDSLCRFILDIRSFLCQLAVGRSRFVLIEMPSGNSIPVKLLARLQF
jgi:hypothetical protein